MIFQDEDNKMDNLDNIETSGNTWAFLSIMLLLQDEQNKKNEWRQFERDLVYKDRFFSKNSFVEALEKNKDKAARTILEGTILFRARLFTENSIDRFLRYYLKRIGCSDDDCNTVINNWPEEAKVLLSSVGSTLQEGEESGDFNSSFFHDVYLKWKKKIRFKGYNAKESGAPDHEIIGNGRANPDHIRYLYLCEDSTTPIYEIRPIISDCVSVARFKVQRNLKVYDLTIDVPDYIEKSKYGFPSYFSIIGKMFSNPVRDNSKQYLPTQYLAEKIKHMGFDGIRFKSSLHKEGVNIVLFDPDLCKAISSEVVRVTDIRLESGDPYQ